MSLDVADVRDACGVRRLAKLNVARVDNALRKEGLGSCPRTLGGKKQGERVRLFVKGSRIGRFLEAARAFNASSDETLRELSSDVGDKLERIRAVLEEVPKVAGDQGPWTVRLAKAADG
jgi:hypothetical protein